MNTTNGLCRPRLMHRVLVAAAATGSLLAATAAAAGATTVIGAGNGAHGNRCANNGSVRTTQPTASSAGTTAGSALALLLSAPADQCGDLGLPKEDKADQPLENTHIDVAE